MRSKATLNTAASSLTSSSVAGRVANSAWHSPLPYLFGGIAVMLGLIAFALLMLTCSYWKHSGDDEGDKRDPEIGEEKAWDGLKPVPNYPVHEDKLVIMAGDKKPTYLATPMTKRVSSFGNTSICNSSGNYQESEKSEKSYEIDKDLQMKNVKEQTQTRATQTYQDQDE